jgi:cytochrome P450
VTAIGQTGSDAGVAALDELELPVLDYTDPDLRGPRVHAEMADLRRQGWLARGPYGYIVLDRESGEFFLRTRSAVFPGMKIAEIFGVTEGPLFEQMRRNILHVNGEQHSRLRGLVNPALSPRAVERYRPQMRAFLAGLFDAAAGSGSGSGSGSGEFVCDFVDAFAKPYPSQVIAHVMGAPLSDAPRLHHWSNWIQRQFDAASMAQEREGIERAVAEFYDYAEGLLERRRAEPGDDLMSMLIAAEAEGDRLSDVECVNLVFNVLAGGVDTTQSQLAHAVRLLAEHPGQWSQLRRDPAALGPAAVEEALRYEPITPFTARILVEDVVHRGVLFPKDTIVMVCAFTGNRDLDADEVGPDGAERFDITAPRGRAKPMTFGAGVHYCLGANLARAEMQEAMGFFAERVESVELDGEVEYGTISGIYGLERLPVRVTVAG